MSGIFLAALWLLTGCFCGVAFCRALFTAEIRRLRIQASLLREPDRSIILGQLKRLEGWE